MNMTIARLASISAVMAAAFLVVAQPANAAVVEQDHYHFSDSFEVDDRCGLNVRIDIVEDGSFSVVQRGPDWQFYGAARFTGSATFTNLANGKTITDSYAGESQDYKVTDNGDGTITVVVQFVGGQRFPTPDGRTVATSSGIFRRLETVDIATGELVADPVVLKEAGRQITDEVYCDQWLVPAIG